ncbi:MULTISPECIES: biopolymer transporter ExbD [unclassified Pseudomonas]|uniref:ExbD/TolR family protein n=1 Tax=unclassified Pseudomonas TaxID=196821 RepID=UPI000BD26811|nr:MULTISPECIES: biopolymer transporter ExbD [unclassified Pseudomonas]PVZ12293.1 biopolymer transport protein ExbD [Pseudomonas sp. URIL14HWK12:I12]PVZ23555.1 biopolymer transport protein ExbD [Pseudomonas sp. URIL14HWK12:I10]PVZ32885.1 biopolymer transport protein ExbD [Pseudomonas sp. URIL14HWK12:I11]SNZ18753.1 biopolymer transport protein ExbD [Pseudomonas sp. URIL14HWK12:I9]
MKFRRRRQREHIDINLASLIDIVFVLLLFFVVTTTFTRETQLRVELPQAVSGAPNDLDEKRIDIAISADGEYAVNDKRLPKSDLDTLMSAIKSEAGDNTALPMSISADGKTPHQAVITAMDAAGKLGFSKLSMTTVEAQGH